MHFFDFCFIVKTKNVPKSAELLLISIRLHELCKKKDYSNYEHIAFELGMWTSVYWRLETGVNFELKTLIKICKLSDITLEYFFKGIELPKPSKK